MKIQIKKDEESGEYYFDLEDIKDIIDISLIETYNLEKREDESFAITFYDKDQNKIMPKVTNDLPK